MKWLGLTGGIASGKSEVTRILNQKGIPVVDADQVAREVVVPGSQGLSQVVKAFGSTILNPDGSLDRTKMGKLVFTNPSQLKQLEMILHPLIQARVKKLRQQLEEKQMAVAFYDVPLLFEKNLQNQFDGVLVVWCQPAQQLKRLMLRDGLSENQAQRRIDLQLPIDEKKSRSDWVIDNSGSPDLLPGKVSEILQKINSV